MRGTILGTHARTKHGSTAAWWLAGAGHDKENYALPLARNRLLVRAIGVGRRASARITCVMSRIYFANAAARVSRQRNLDRDALFVRRVVTRFRSGPQADWNSVSLH